MDHIPNPQHARAHDRLAARRVSEGYSLDDISIATGLTVAEIVTAEGGGPGKPRRAY
jgi:hypothetical protein